MGVLSDTLKSLRIHANKSSSIEDKMKTAGQPGSRLTPARSNRNDTKLGGRLDFGSTFTKDGKQYQNVNFQLNKNAESESIQAMVKKNGTDKKYVEVPVLVSCLLYTSPSPRDGLLSRMPSSA